MWKGTWEWEAEIPIPERSMESFRFSRGMGSLASWFQKGVQGLQSLVLVLGAQSSSPGDEGLAASAAPCVTRMPGAGGVAGAAVKVQETAAGRRAQHGETPGEPIFHTWNSMVQNSMRVFLFVTLWSILIPHVHLYAGLLKNFQKVFPSYLKHFTSDICPRSRRHRALS